MTGQIPRSDDLATVIIVSPSDDRQHLIVCHAHIARPVACSESQQKGSPYTNPLLIKFKCRIHVVHSRGGRALLQPSVSALHFVRVTTQAQEVGKSQGILSPCKGEAFPLPPSLSLPLPLEVGPLIQLRGLGSAFVERIKRVWWQQNCSFCSSVWGQIFT